ncbi:hypothetical protein A3849_01110 [Paenibacillus sp. P46E]|nr:hypothetical protein A3849_01110 [Paenibacillus sp. P46E]
MEGGADLQAVIKGGLCTADIPAVVTDTSATHLRTHTMEEMDINIIRIAMAAQADPSLFENCSKITRRLSSFG